MTHGGRLAARTLKAAGVDCIFTLSGGHVMGIYDGCIDEGIRVVDVRHEQAAVHAADAWARLHPGRVGVAVLTNAGGTPAAGVLARSLYDRLLGLSPIDWAARYRCYPDLY